MQLKCKIETGALSLSGSRIMDLDISTSVSFIPFGEVHLDNSDGELSGKISAGQTFDIFTSLVMDSATEPQKIFTGKVKQFFDEKRMRVIVQGVGAKYRETKFKRTYNQAKARRVINDIVSDAGMQAQIGSIPDKELHTFMCPNGSHLEEIGRAITSYGLDLVPYWDRTGKLILKSVKENLRETGIKFNSGEFAKFENYILHTAMDSQIDLFNVVTVLDKKYYVTAHRFKAGINSAKSMITLVEYAG